LYIFKNQLVALQVVEVVVVKKAILLQKWAPGGFFMKKRSPILPCYTCYNSKRILIEPNTGKGSTLLQDIKNYPIL